MLMSSFQEGEILGYCKIVYHPHKPNKSQAGGGRLWIQESQKFKLSLTSSPAC